MVSLCLSYPWTQSVVMKNVTFNSANIYSMYLQLKRNGEVINHTLWGWVCFISS